MRFRRWAAGLAVLAWFGVAGSALAGVMSRAEFRLEVRDEIVRREPKAKISLEGEDRLNVRLPGAKDEDGLSLFIGNAYERYQNNPAKLEDIVGQMSRLVLTYEEKPAIAPESLVILLRPAELLRQPGFEKIKLLTRPFAGDFVEVIAVDTGETFRMGVADEVAPLFANEAQAWDRARSNTSAKMGRMQIGSLEPGVWTVTNDSSLALEFVNQPETWAVHGVVLKGDPIVVFSQRNLLLLADGGDKERIQRFTAFVDAIADDPEIISTTLFTRRNGVWSVLERKP